MTRRPGSQSARDHQRYRVFSVACHHVRSWIAAIIVVYVLIFEVLPECFVSFHEIDSFYEERKLHFRTHHLDVIVRNRFLWFWKSALTWDVWHEGNECINASESQNPKIRKALIIPEMTWKWRLWLPKQRVDIRRSQNLKSALEWRWRHWESAKIHFGSEDPRLTKLSDLIEFKNSRTYLCLPPILSYCSDEFLDHLLFSVSENLYHFVQSLYFETLVMISITLLCADQCFPAYQ